MNPTRPAHRDPALLGLVALGGTVGSMLRYGTWLLMPRPGGWPLGTLTVNLVGAFVLGFLLEAIAVRGPETRRLQRIRLGVGTGVVGGFTTYSSFALEVERLLSDGAAGVAVGYAALTLVAGTALAVLGVWLGSRVSPSTAARLLRAEREAEREAEEAELQAEREAQR